MNRQARKIIFWRCLMWIFGLMAARFCLHMTIAEGWENHNIGRSTAATIIAALICAISHFKEVSIRETPWTELGTTTDPELQLCLRVIQRLGLTGDNNPALVKLPLRYFMGKPLKSGCAIEIVGDSDGYRCPYIYQNGRINYNWF